MNWAKIAPWAKNKYILAFLVFGLWVLFIDTFDWFTLHSNQKKLENLKREQRFYELKIENAQKEFEDLTSNERAMERFARETYFMKRPNEDIFIIVDTINATP